MENIISSFFDVTTLVLCIIVYLAVSVIRQGVEFGASKIAYIFPDKWEPWWVHAWRTVVLPALPFAVGALVILLFPAYPIPVAFAVSLEGKLAFGLVAGGFSGLVYKFFKDQVKKLTEVKEEKKSKE